jgi:hypothetical protein
MSVRRALATILPTTTIITIAVACGSSGGGGGGGKMDAPGSGSSNCSVAASYGTTTFTGQVALNEGSGSGQLAGLYTESLKWQGGVTSTPQVGFELDVFGGGGGSNTPDWPTALGAVASVSLAMTTVDAGGVFLGNINATTHQVGDLYFSTGGTLAVTAASGSNGGTFSGSVSSIAATHGTFDNSGNFVPATDNCKSTLSGGSFTATIMAAGSGGIPNVEGGWQTDDGSTLDEQMARYHAYLLAHHE